MAMYVVKKWVIELDPLIPSGKGKWYIDTIHEDWYQADVCATYQNFKSVLTQLKQIKDFNLYNSELKEVYEKVKDKSEASFSFNEQKELIMAYVEALQKYLTRKNYDDVRFTPICKVEVLKCD